jgi:hypothetical protein
MSVGHAEKRGPNTIGGKRERAVSKYGPGGYNYPGPAAPASVLLLHYVHPPALFVGRQKTVIRPSQTRFPDDHQ